MDQDPPIRISRREDVILIDVRGDVTIVTEPHFEQAYEHVRMQQVKKVLLLFSGDVYINSGGIVALSQLLIRARAADQKVAIAGLSDHFKKIFEMVGITRVARIHDTPEQALADLAAATAD